MNPIQFDETNTLLTRRSDTDEKLRRAMQRLSGPDAPGFLALPEDQEGHYFATSLADRFREKGELLVVGIGGSALGVRAIDEALDRKSTSALVVSDNVDPVGLFDRLASLDPEHTVVNVVSKSGGTVETAAQWLVIHGWLREALGPRWRQHVVVTTDPFVGELRDWANAEGLPTLPVPSNVGGRFSVLTPVGLFPLAMASHDTKGLLIGAALARDACLAHETGGAAGQIARFHLDHLPGRRVTVFSAYGDRIRLLGAWFQQLWAESLGKGGHGWTTCLAPGTTDQHSQLQLFMEGPDHHLFLFCGVSEPEEEITIPTQAEGAPPLATYLGGRTMGELLDVERMATAAALARMGRPSLGITLPRLDGVAVGAFVMTMEIATALTGFALGIDPFNQPGVELGKKLAYHQLGRPGYEDAP